jgi:histidinol-phosphate aminotransferase
MIRMKKNLEEVVSYKPGRPIEEVQRELGLARVDKLASNESPFGPSPKIYEAIAEAGKKVNLYPDSHCYYLRQELAARCGIEPSQLIFGNGSDEIIALAIKTFVEHDENIVVATPTFLMYSIYAKICGVGVKSVPMKAYKYDLPAMADAIDSKTKIVFVANPDNPNGTYCTGAEIEAFMKRVPENVLVFLDEAYGEFMPSDGPDSQDLLKRYPNLLYAKTFSKTYGLAGLRIGYGVARNEVIACMGKVRDPFNTNLVAQAAALAALKDEEYMRKVVSYVNAEKDYVYTAFDKAGLKYVRSATNFIMVLTEKGKSTEITKRLLQKGIIVRDMADWGYTDCIRVSMGQHEQNERFVTEFLAAVK